MPKIASNPNLVDPSTTILTNNGWRTLADLKDSVIHAWNGMDYADVKVDEVTEFTVHDQRNTVVISFDSNRSITVAKSFRFKLKDGTKVRARDLKVGDVLNGWRLPTGSIDIAQVTAVEKGAELDLLYGIEEPILGTLFLNGIAVPDERG